MSFLDERFVAAIVRLTEKTQKLRSSDHELPAGRSEPAPAVTGNFSIRTQQQADANATSSTTQVSTMSTLSRGAGGVAPSTGGDVESDSDHDDEDDFHSSQMLVSGFRGALLVRNDTNNEGAVDENGRRRKAFRSLNETDRVKAELSVFGTMLDQQKPQQARELPRVLAEEGFYDPDRPEISDSNRQLLEARLMREDPSLSHLFRSSDHTFLHAPLPTFDRPMVSASGSALTRDEAAASAMWERALQTKRVRATKQLGTTKYYDFKINLRELRLQDHPLMSKEDLLCAEIERDYDEYQRRRAINLFKFYSTRLESLRTQSRNQLEELARLENVAYIPPNFSAPSAKATLNALPPFTAAARTEHIAALVKRSLLTLSEIASTREEKDLEEGEQMRLFSRIYKTWRKLSAWRVAEGARLGLTEDEPVASVSGSEVENMASTIRNKRPRAFAGQNMRISVEEIKSGELAAEQQQWKNAIDDELRERHMLHLLKERLQIMSADKSVVSAFDESRTLSLIERRRTRHCRAPGRSTFVPVLDRRGQVSELVDCSVEEKDRRDAIAQTRICARLSVNGNELGRTAYHRIEYPRFATRIDFTFHLRLLRPPDELKIELMSEGFFGDNRMATLYLPVPAVTAAPSTSKIEFSGSERMQFSDTKIKLLEQHLPPDEDDVRAMSPDGGVVDAEAVMSLMRNRHGDRYICGELEHNIEWAIDNSSELIVYNKAVVTQDNQSDSLVELVRDLKEEIDPNDPRNLAMLEYQRRARSVAARGKVFSHTALQNDLRLNVTGVKPDGSIGDTVSGRLQILKMRKDSDLLRHEYVPLRDADIPAHLYAALRDSKMADTDDMFRSDWTAKQLLHRPRRVHSCAEVVNELPPPDFSVNFGAIFECLAPTRKLHVQRIDREPVANPASCRVVVQVVRAANLPRRRNLDARRGVNTKRKGDDSIDPVPSIDVKFQGRTQSTSAATSTANPQWNQVMVFDFRPPNGQFTPNSVVQCTDDITFSLFDNIVVESSEDSESRRSGAKTTVTERRWLGNVSLPFSTIYLNGSKAEGFFRVDTPMLNLAYTDPATSATRDRSDTSALNGSYLWVYATLDPPLVMPGEGATLAPAEQAFSRFCQQWVDTVSARPECTDRFITALCEDENQDTQIITQYVYPQPPPFDFKEGQFVRFISRIPFVEDVQASGSRDVWCSAPAFLGMGFGDWEEHAVLLANYFIYLDMKQNQTSSTFTDTYVCLGSAVPEGRAVFVLRRYIALGRIKHVYIYDAVAGRRYRSVDPLCPLKTIGCIFNGENIWANIQTLDLAHTTFDFNNADCWVSMVPKDLQPSPPVLNSALATTSASSATPAAAMTSRVLSATPAAGAGAGAGAQAEEGEQLIVMQPPAEPSWWSACMRSITAPSTFTRDYVIEKMLTINGAPILYKETSIEACLIREGQIKRAIQQQFEAKRSRSQTRWEFAVSDILRDLLVNQFEFAMQGQDERKLNVDDHEGLKKIRSIYGEIYGVPLNFPDNMSSELKYTEASEENPIVQAVLNVGIHEVDHPNARFALAVHVFPYVNNIASVWVYIASLSSSRVM